MATTSVDGITIELDLLGSTANLGVDSNRRDRALRRGLVKGLTASVEDGLPKGTSHTLMQRAAQEVFDAVGLFHHTITDLRLQDIRTRQWGLTKVWVDLVYFRGFENTGFLDGQFGGTFEYTRTQHNVLPVYRHTTNLTNGDPVFGPHGLPAGPMIGNAPNRLDDQRRFPLHKMWSRESTLISVPTVLTAHPYSAPGVADRIGLVNSGTVSIGSIGFAPFTLKFLSADVNVRFGGFGHGQQSSVLYDTIYEFEAIASGHYHQTPLWNPGPPQPPDEWGTVEAVEFPALSFVGGFPLGI